MFFKLLLCFTIIPIAELYLLIEVGSQIGAAPTMCIVLLTGVAGAWLAKKQGTRAMSRMQESMAQGAMPAEAMIDAFLILVAGVVLLTPGFLTDITGLLLLIPYTRGIFKQWLRIVFEKWARQGTVTITRFPPRY